VGLWWQEGPDHGSDPGTTEEGLRLV
jgi:hypothetical protein